MPTKIKTAITYYWTALDHQGKRIKGETNAIHPVLIKVYLSQQGLKQIKIRKKISLPFLMPKINVHDIALFSRELATLLIAGIPLLQALELIIRGHKKITMQNLVTSIRNAIDNGNSIATALTQFPQYFSPLYRNLINVGEKSGTLDDMLDRIATYQEKVIALKNKIKKALFYPITVVIVAFAVTVSLLIFVVPQFETLFANAGAPLPLLTQVIIRLSAFIQCYGWIFLVIPSLLGYAAKIWKTQSTTGSKIIDSLLLKIPIIGEALKNAAIARFTHTLATTLTAGLPVIEALQAAGETAGNRTFTTAILNLRTAIMGGEMLHKALHKTLLFPSMLIQMIAIGEESGTLTEMLNRLANIFEDKVDTTVTNLSNLLEPFIMIVLGVVIGGLVIAMYLPIFKLGNVI